MKVSDIDTEVAKFKDGILDAHIRIDDLTDSLAKL